MRFKYIKLKDIGPFTKKQIDFDGHLIGIIGPNGSGKSTLIELLYSAVTDHFRKYSKLVEFVRDKPNGDKCNSGFVEVCFSHGSIDFTVRRTISVSKDKEGELRGTQKAALRIVSGDSDPVEVTGVKNVNAALREALGEDIYLLGNYAFISQNEISFLVDSDASTRTRAMHKLFGLERFERIWSILGDEMRTIPELRSSDDTDALKSEKEAFLNQKQVAQDNLKQIRQQLADMDVVTAQSDIDKWESLSDVRDQLTSASERVSNAQGYAVTRESQAASAKSELRRVCEEQQKLRPKYAEAKEFLEKANEVRYYATHKAKLQDRASKLIQEYSALSPPVLKVDADWGSEDEAHYSRLLSELSVSSNFVSEHAELLEGDDVKAKCPTCGQPIEDLAASLEIHRRTVATLAPQVNTLSDKKARIDNAKREYELAQATYNERVARLRQDVANVQAEHADLVAKCVDAPEAYNDNVCNQKRQIVSEYDSLSGSLKAAERTYNTEQHNADQAQVELRQAIESRNALQQKLASLQVDVEKMTSDHISYCRGVVKSASDRKVEVVRLEEQIRQLDMQIKSLDSRIERALELQAQIDRIKLVRANLSDARSVFRRDKLPMLLAKRFLTALDSNIQRFLQLMQSDFTAELEQVDGSYNFLCTFGDATQRDASLLSGGEKVRFSISFLLAVNEVLSARFGVLALDEPTAQLDDDNIQYFMDVLSHVQEYAANSGVQVFLITHSAQLVGSFDQAVMLPKAA